MATSTTENTMTNLHVALLNGIALITVTRTLRWLANGQIANTDIQKAMGEGGWVSVSSTELAKMCGYPRLAGYHFKLLDTLAEWGYIKAEYVKGGKRAFKLTELGYSWTVGRI